MGSPKNFEGYPPSSPPPKRRVGGVLPNPSTSRAIARSATAAHHPLATLPTRYLEAPGRLGRDRLLAEGCGHGKANAGPVIWQQA